MDDNKILCWNYDSTDRFFDTYFKDLITDSMVSGQEMFLEKYKDKDGYEVETARFYFPFKKDKHQYLIPSELVDDMPIKITKKDKVSYMGKGYTTPHVDESSGEVSIKKMRIRPELMMQPYELIEQFSSIPHSNPDDDWLIKVIALTSYLDRINVRVATNPAFGKNSKLLSLKSLTGEVAVVSNPTMAKMKHLLINEVLVVDEVAGMKSETKKDIEQFILASGDFRNVFENNSRSANGTSESTKISKLSTLYFYNTLDNYSNAKKYFDYMWDNCGAITDRIFPVKLSGDIDMNVMPTNFDSKQVVKDNWDFYLKFLRTIQYLKTEYQTHNFETKQFDFGRKARWKRNFDTIQKWIGVFSKNQQQFSRMSELLYQRHKDYIDMLEDKVEVQPLIVKEDKVSNNASSESLNKSVLRDKLLTMLRENGRMDGDTLRDNDIDDTIIQQAKQLGEIVEIKNDFYEVLE